MCLSASQVIDEVRAQGGIVERFTSVCGGLTAPDALDVGNPLQYKFSWSPRGVLSAAQNSAKYLQDGKEVQVQAGELLASAEPFGGFPSLQLEVLPNRDSTIYQRLYGLEGAHTVFRGTLRYEGWSDVMYGFQVRS